MKKLVIALMVLGICSKHCVAQDLSPNNLDIVSLNNAGDIADSHADNPAVSDDGRFVAFQSSATNLAPGHGGSSDIYLRDRQNNSTIRVSQGLGNTPSNGNSTRPAITPDGRYVAFTSLATNLVIADNNGNKDAFVYDRLNNSIERISIRSDGNEGSQDTGDQVSISDDGQLLTFVGGGDLATPAAANNEHVYLHNRSTGQTTLVSQAAGTEANAASRRPYIEGSGKHIIFISEASNLVPGDGNAIGDIFSCEVSSGTMSRVSLTVGGNEITDLASNFRPVIAANGRISAMIHPSGQLLSSDSNGRRDIIIHDNSNGQNSAVSQHSNGDLGNHNSAGSAISEDGRFISFWSDASNLVDNDNNASRDTFLYDRESQNTFRINLSRTGQEADGASSQTDISGNGQFIAFGSAASNITPTANPSGQRQILLMRNPMMSNDNHAVPSLPIPMQVILFSALLGLVARFRAK
ncbi:hypothetical protein [uncultured Pseudoteredinibacter sp.]|uniref:hypothetical protein n=1 Tax=uncultured Pseudoteredinibacter sp. TaxID=1641701 RepID=UPI00261EF573|nr:hypothetical protein [uncultured Pseudoteredinibacter sp.]